MTMDALDQHAEYHDEYHCESACTICAIRAMTVRLEAALGKIEAAVKAGFEREAQRYTEERESLPGTRCRSVTPDGRASCARAVGHAGDHVAYTRAGFSLARWPNTDPHNSPDAGKEE